MIGDPRSLIGNSGKSKGDRVAPIDDSSQWVWDSGDSIGDFDW
jgi:hypothetical protein